MKKLKIFFKLNFLRKIGLYNFFQRLKVILYFILRTLTFTNQKLLNELLNSEIKKIHIGCGCHFIEGWLNADYNPYSVNVFHLDATKTFPFPNNEIDFIYSEHMIEHINYEDGKFMLKECFRILKPSGKLRISTPDLYFLIDLYRNDKSKLQMKFIKHSTDKWISYAPGYEDTFVINNYMRAWGHKFIYDEKVLNSLLKEIGFVNIKRFTASESQDEFFQNLENVSRKPDGLINLESLVLEAMKP